MSKSKFNRLFNVRNDGSRNVSDSCKKVVTRPDKSNSGWTFSHFDKVYCTALLSCARDRRQSVMLYNYGENNTLNIKDRYWHYKTSSPIVSALKMARWLESIERDLVRGMMDQPRQKWFVRYQDQGFTQGATVASYEAEEQWYKEDLKEVFHRAVQEDVVIEISRVLYQIRFEADVSGRVKVHPVRHADEVTYTENSSFLCCMCFPTSVMAGFHVAGVRCWRITGIDFQTMIHHSDLADQNYTSGPLKSQIYVTNYNFCLLTAT